MNGPEISLNGFGRNLNVSDVDLDGVEYLWANSNGFEMDLDRD